MDSIFTLLIGIVCVGIGIVNFRGNVSTLHAYHRKRVSEEDMPAFARLIGIGTIVIGAAMILMSALSFMAEKLQQNAYNVAGIVILIIGFVVGFGLSFYAIFKYNKGLF